MFKNNRRNKLIALFVAIAALAIFVNIPFLPKYIESPGTAPNLKPVVSIKGHSDKFKGKFMFTTVSESQASIASYVVAKFNPHQTIESISDVTGNQDQQSYINLQNVYMESAINNAIYNAFHYAKKDVYLKYRGIYVLAVDSKSNFYNQIKAGDSIVSLNGHKFKSSAQFRDYVKSKKIGSKMTLTVYRNKKKIQITRKLYKLAGTNQAGIGIILSDDNQVSTKIPIDVNPGEVGGPSAGLMFSLQIYGQLTQQNIRHSQNIAGTGTIDESGNVGEIGGIDKKIIAARDAGAKYFLAPYVKPTKEVLKYEDQHMTNYQLAVKTAKKYAPNMKVIPVTSFSDALNALKKIK